MRGHVFTGWAEIENNHGSIRFGDVSGPGGETPDDTAGHEFRGGFELEDNHGAVWFGDLWNWGFFQLEDNYSDI